MNILKVADEEEIDRRQWLLAVVRHEKPVESYLRWSDSIDDAMSIDTDIIENHPLRDWLRAT